MSGSDLLKTPPQFVPRLAAIPSSSRPVSTSALRLSQACPHYPLSFLRPAERWVQDPGDPRQSNGTIAATGPTAFQCRAQRPRFSYQSWPNSYRTRAARPGLCVKGPRLSVDVNEPTLRVDGAFSD